MNRLHSQRIQRLLICQFSLLSLVIFASDLNSKCLILIQFSHDIFDACVLGGQTDVTAATEIAVESDTDDADGSDAASEGCDRRDPDFWYGLGGCYWSGGRGFADFLDWLGLVSNYCHPYG
jgi:hypothetical protein